MPNDVIHHAIVTAVGSTSVTLRIDSGNDCPGCKIAAVCGGSSDALTQRVEVPNPERFTVDEQVLLIASDAATWRAITIGLAIPCLIVLGGLLALLAVGFGSLWAIAGAFAMLLIYFVVVGCNRHWVESRLRWHVEKVATTKS